jgi:hypothetical protein
MMRPVMAMRVALLSVMAMIVLVIHWRRGAVLSRMGGSKGRAKREKNHRHGSKNGFGRHTPVSFWMKLMLGTK